MQETACSAGDPVLILRSGRSPGEGILTPVFLPRKFRGQNTQETQTSAKVKTRVHLMGQSEGVCPGREKVRLVGRVDHALKSLE